MIGNLTLAMMRQQQERLRIQENSARLAYQNTTHETTGNGWVAPKDPIYFDTKFTTEPSVTHGSRLVKAPDYRYWKFPQITGGVTDWIVQGGLYVGAHLFFAVDIQPIKLPRTDGSNLSELQSALEAEIMGSANYNRYQTLVLEAYMAQALATNPARTVVHHYLVFSGVALKGMPTEITEELHSDSQIAPLIPPLYANG